MPTFTPKKIPLDETLGEQLRQRRHLKNWKIETIAQRLNIRPDYLVALETEDFDKLPAGLYGKNFLKEYAIFLGLDPRPALKYWEERNGSHPTDDPFSQKIVKKNKFIVFPKIVRNTIVVGLVLVCLLYLLFYWRGVIAPPDLIVSQPAQNLVTTDHVIIVSGHTDPEAEVRINNEVILNNNRGDFSQTINLKTGLNNLTITAQKKYSQEKIITREILVE